MNNDDLIRSVRIADLGELEGLEGFDDDFQEAWDAAVEADDIELDRALEELEVLRDRKLAVAGLRTLPKRFFRVIFARPTNQGSGASKIFQGRWMPTVPKVAEAVSLATASTMIIFMVLTLGSVVLPEYADFFERETALANANAKTLRYESALAARDRRIGYLLSKLAEANSALANCEVKLGIVADGESANQTRSASPGNGSSNDKDLGPFLDRNPLSATLLSYVADGADWHLSPEGYLGIRSAELGWTDSPGPLLSQLQLEVGNQHFPQISSGMSVRWARPDFGLKVRDRSSWTLTGSSSAGVLSPDRFDSFDQMVCEPVSYGTFVVAMVSQSALE